MENSENQNQQLANYIKKNVSKGYTLDSLKYSLMQQGYSRTSVEKAMQIANKQLASEAPKMVEKPVITYSSFDENELKEKVESQDNPFKKFLNWFKR